MKKVFYTALIAVVLTSCFNDDGSDTGTNQASEYTNDSAQISNPDDTTSVMNNNAYNTTDTGLSSGTTSDTAQNNNMNNRQ